ncbi:MAG TPA: BatA domain-containing protein [Gemmatimonadales bacterium]|nr:BatA domain-containing protein [Gemmatimonadales bacterium]
MNPLAFLVPAFLAGLAAIAIPVLVHLRHRERKEPVRFPSLMFLRRIPFREVRRQQIHHWPLFLLRVLAVALLVFAFARPFLRGRDAPLVATGAQGKELVILLDRSASMGYGSRWSRAQSAARDAVNGMGRDDRASVVLFDQGAAVNTRPTSDRTMLLAAIDAAKPGTATTRYAPALRAAGELLTGTHLPRREAVLISDFQRTGWKGDDLEPLPEGTVLKRVNVGRDSAPNLAIVNADLTSSPAGTVVRARIAGSGITTSLKTRAILELDGRPSGTRDVWIERDGIVTVAFDPASLGAAGARGVVRLEATDSLAADDTFLFVASGERPLRVLLIESPEAAPFLRRVLEISRVPRVELKARPSLRADELTTSDVVILNDVPFPAGDAGRRLEEAVRGGIGLVVIAGASAGGWPQTFIPTKLGGTVDRSATGGARLGVLRRDHPMFEPFRGPRSGDFGAARVWRYRAVPGDSLEALARHDDGSVALAEVKAGRGRVLIWASALDNVWSDAPLQPVFLPLIHQVAHYAAGWVERSPAWSVGEVATVAIPQGSGTQLLVLGPDGERERREPQNSALAVALEESGFYEVREGRSGGKLLAVIAANPPAEETRLEAFDPDDLRLATGAVDSVSSRPDVSTLSPQEAEKRQGLWWYLLAGVTVLLVGELLLANRAGRRAGVQPGSDSSMAAMGGTR